MDIKTAEKLLKENLHNIFVWSMSRLYDKQEAEDLSQDIIYAVLKSVHNLKNEDAFYGYMWRIAENVLCARLRKKRPESVSFDENFCGVYWNTPESEFIKSESINLLRRELSLLSEHYREVTVKYYIYGKSCFEISSELNISQEMVKYYLFKARKILKEGISMVREYGTKSYNPQIFKIDFWGEDGNIYWDLFNRKLPGNIVLSAYEKPVTVKDLSLELGVSAPFLEDELNILEKHSIVKKVKDKYQTNIIIFTDEYEKSVLQKFKPVYEKAAVKVSEVLDTLLPKLKGFKFYNNKFNDNELKWVFTNLIMYHALRKTDNGGRKEYGDYPVLSNGSYGFIFGYDNDYANHHFNGIYGKADNRESTAWISVTNYRIIEKIQHWKSGNWENSIEAMCDAVLCKNAGEYNGELVRLIDDGFIKSDNGKLSANFVVFKQSDFDKIQKLLTPCVDEVSDCMIKIIDIAEKDLKKCVPDALKTKCGQLAHIHHQMDGMAFIVETMVDNKYLVLPTDKANICMFGVMT